jgi:hypothetical protein
MPFTAREWEKPKSASIRAAGAANAKFVKCFLSLSLNLNRG